MKFFKKKQPEPASFPPHDELRIVRMLNQIDSNCGICLEWQSCTHYDRDLIDVICPGCATHVRGAEIQLRAFIVKRMAV